MNAAARFAVVGTSLFLCAAGIFFTLSYQDGKREIAIDHPANWTGLDAEYQYAASGERFKLTLQQLEAIIQRDAVAQSQKGKLEFGFVRMERGTVLAEVVFVESNGHVQPFLYKLELARKSWKVANVQRLWYVPRSHLLRGVRA
jgi:hypothetical protein